MLDRSGVGSVRDGAKTSKAKNKKTENTIISFGIDQTQYHRKVI